jgi:mono/diheme cytochrome c family protein
VSPLPAARCRRWPAAACVAALCVAGLCLGGCDVLDPVHSPGERLFRDHCANCHGRNGTGTLAYSGDNYIDLTDDAWQSGGSEYAIGNVIRNGVFGAMPPNPQLTDQEVKELTQYVLSLHAGSQSH